MNETGDIENDDKAVRAKPRRRTRYFVLTLFVLVAATRLAPTLSNVVLALEGSAPHPGVVLKKPPEPSTDRGN